MRTDKMGSANRLCARQEGPPLDKKEYDQGHGGRSAGTALLLLRGQVVAGGSRPPSPPQQQCGGPGVVVLLNHQARAAAPQATSSAWAKWPSPVAGTP
eukprot:CAMPEP_0206413540 /NCGR_PEP_ID=MMETSP0294-20121207/34730_1 /ASSEMBLY_ACC=CAM_ASM_000327 /TAXON_ID=39354 /ORGANISM="Heterosigma akashiwo, Strain CCMP2393" /LENGTH=97 /DNA_ID=CAMNT_0053875059 /DNA_START=210 /DNA_END=501 /DNA_ORIENTATION=-